MCWVLGVSGWWLTVNSYPPSTNIVQTRLIASLPHCTDAINRVSTTS
ncbi:MAG: hypothetical protein KME54_00700 [Tolypothrix brevis GSE-NOS-MK-07-07A]|nr:hypothetical protein [Tolypothrix brevis GSE-NOS-MK-07-07A]